MGKDKKKTLGIAAAAAAGLLAGLGIAAKINKGDSIYDNAPEEKNPLEGKKVVFVPDDSEPENADGAKGHLEAVGPADDRSGIYDRYIKRAADIALSFGGMLLLSPVLAGISLAIYIDDPGPVIFTQKRIGRNKRYFKLHKFRSMKMSTPHDVPTHMLDDPDKYITRVGKFIRAHSLDELPQIWDIFIGNMSVIGPRPGLWNQDVLTAERDKYGANEVNPGLTGWAQINGRDELELADKAKFDGEYAQKESPAFDMKCFFGTVSKVFSDDSVVEGGTTAMEKEEIIIHDPDDKDTVPAAPKKILITGADSYIGDSVKRYLEKQSDFYSVDILSTIGLKAEPAVFRGYDTVFNVAGIAHIKETDENRHLYYEVNRDLVCDIAKAAKEAGVKQLILLSTMSVYGISKGHITKETEPAPVNAYGRSKIEADTLIAPLAGDTFRIAFLRPPMVYGKGCKGNYQKLRLFAMRSPIFPNYRNRRSMIYIGNLCEFVKRVIDREAEGVFFPQNEEYVNTSEMVRLIAKAHNRKMRLTSLFNPMIRIAPVNIIDKVFGSLTYEKTDLVSKYSFEESVRLSEAE